MDKLIKRTVRLISSSMEVDIAHVSAQAGYRCGHIPKNAILPYLQKLSAQKLSELGISVPKDKKKVDTARPGLPMSARASEKAN